MLRKIMLDNKMGGFYMKRLIGLIFAMMLVFSSSCLAWSRFAVMEPFNVSTMIKEINSNNTFNGDLKVIDTKLNGNGEYECKLSDNKSIMVFEVHKDLLISVGLFADGNNYQAPINTLYSIFERSLVGNRNEFWTALEKSYKTKKAQPFASQELTKGKTIYWSVEAKNYNNYLFVGISCWYTD